MAQTIDVSALVKQRRRSQGNRLIVAVSDPGITEKRDIEFYTIISEYVVSGTAYPASYPTKSLANP